MKIDIIEIKDFQDTKNLRFLRASKISKALAKIKKKDPVLFSAVRNKIKQIASYDEISIQHLKNLRHDSSEYKRVQVGSFILFFRLEGDTIIFGRFKHHDYAYRK